MIMYSVFDTKVGTFMPPFTVQHPVLAIRAFVELASDAATMVAKNPADFCLMEIAHFDPGHGVRDSGSGSDQQGDGFVLPGKECG